MISEQETHHGIIHGYRMLAQQSLLPWQAVLIVNLQ